MGKSKSSKQRNKKIEKRKKRSALKKKAAIKTKIRSAVVEKHLAEVEKHLKEYPNFHYQDYDKESVSAEFVEEVKQILNNLNFNDSTLFAPARKDFFKQMKQHGFNNVIDILKERIPEKERFDVFGRYFILIGNIVFKKLKQKGVLKNFIPYNDFNISPHGTDFTVSFAGMLWEKTKWGRVYYSPKKPKISIEGKEYIVAFSNHAIQRICDRSVDDWAMYNDVRVVFDFLHEYSKFELVKTTQKNGVQYFLALYNLCIKGFVNYNYVTKLLKTHNPNKKYYQRMGYCPVVVSDDFASAKTLLIPGMRGTPEYIKMKDSDLDFNDKKRYEELAGSILEDELVLDSSDWDAVRWYHENDIPQVVELDEDPLGRDLNKIHELW